MDHDFINHSQCLLIYHVILVTKYRHKILDMIDVCSIMKEVEKQSDFVILEQESDLDHIHLMIKHAPKYSPSSLVRRLKMLSTSIAWKLHKDTLKKYYWKKKILWSNGFFMTTVGNASIETIRKYIQEQ